MGDSRHDELKLVGRVVSHYKILEPLGEGGMGVVYLAEDTSLGRLAALKFLPRSLTRDADARHRFIHEAQAASAILHPNICTVYEIKETSDGLTFIAMAYYEGEDLSELIARGPLPVGQAVDIALQIAQGLGATHRKQIIHRDLKPGNVIVDGDGLVTVVDFGLAKLAGRTQITRIGATVGTAAYMAPEQVRGESVDERADVWALGVLLCEMVTGRRLFEGDFEQAVFFQIVHEEPDLVGLPASVLPIVQKCLQRDPKLRYESMRALAGDLRKVGTASAAGRSAFLRLTPVPQRAAIGGSALLLFVIAAFVLVPSNRTALVGWFNANPMPEARHLTVLPIRNVNRDAAGDAYCSGLMETLTSKLTHLEQFTGERFWVVPASEVLSKSVESAEEARRVFGANLVINGSFHRQEEAVRLTLNLINAETGFVIASEVVDRQSSDAIALQDEAIIRVAEMLHMEVPAEADRMFKAGGTIVPGAEEYYLQGRGYLNDYQKSENVELAIGLFERALEEDSTYALAHAGLAEAFWQKYVGTKDVQWVDVAVRHAERALELDDMLAPAHVILGTTHSAMGQHDQALQAFQRALEIDPFSAEGYEGRATVYEAQGKFSEAEQTLRKAISLRPSYWAGYNRLGYFYYFQSRYDEAGEAFQTVINLTPQNAIAYRNLGSTYHALGQTDDAKRAFHESIQLEQHYGAYTNLATIYFYEGNFSDAAETYQKALELQDTDYRIWAGLGESLHWSGDQPLIELKAWQKAHELAREALQLNPNDPLLLAEIAGYEARLGRQEEALKSLKAAVTARPRNGETFFVIAVTYEQLGDRATALVWIKRCIDSGYTMSEIEREPSLRDLRTDTRFRQLIDPGSL